MRVKFSAAVLTISCLVLSPAIALDIQGKPMTGAAAGTGAGATSFKTIMLNQLSCAEVPQAAKTMHQLIDSGILHSKRLLSADSVSYYALEKPEEIDGITAIAVFGFDEEGFDPKLFEKPVGGSPGNLIGIVTRDDPASVDAWIKKHGQDLTLTDSVTSIRKAKDISCRKPSP